MELEHAGPKHYVVQTTEFTYDEPHLYWPDLDNVLEAPVAFKSNVIQQIGRVARGTENAVTVYDFHERQVPALTAAFRKRSAIVRKQGFVQSSARTPRRFPVLKFLWGQRGSNPRPADYESAALTD